VADDSETQESRELTPDVVLMDLRLLGGSGIDTTATICNRWPNAKILMFTTFEGDEHIYRAMQAGARGYILKSSPRAELLEAIHQPANLGVGVLDEPCVYLHEPTLECAFGLGDRVPRGQGGVARREFRIGRDDAELLLPGEDPLAAGNVASSVEDTAVKYRRWGRLLTLANRFFPGVRTSFLFAAGLFRVPFRDVLVFATLSALVWNSLLVGVGFALGANIDDAIDGIVKYSFYAWGAVFVILAALAARFLVKRSRRARAARTGA